MAAPQRLPTPAPAPDLIKHREILFQAVHADREQARSAARLLREVEGILEVAAPSATRLELTYDLAQVCLRDIESALEEVGFHLDNSLLSKVRRAVWGYAEDAQRANLGCDDPRNCSRRIFVDAYRHHAHGCRDDRPEHLRLYW
jgi:hypothetical protein